MLEQRGITLDWSWTLLQEHWMLFKGTIDINDCFRAMLTTWLKMVQPKPTLATLAEALQSPTVGFRHLAEQIQALK